jgi:hypothetical protein
MATQTMSCTTRRVAAHAGVPRGRIYGVVGLGNKLTCGLCDTAPDRVGNIVISHAVEWGI